MVAFATVGQTPALLPMEGVMEVASGQVASAVVPQSRGWAPLGKGRGLVGWNVTLAETRKPARARRGPCPFRHSRLNRRIGWLSHSWREH